MSPYVLLLACFAAAAIDDPPAPEHQTRRYRTHSLRGQVVWLGDALSAQGVEVDDDARQSLVVLKTDDGPIAPIVKDTRGRAFWLDERLRNVDVELLVRQYDGSPMVQVIRVYRLTPEGRFEVDYWCDLCAIPMFEPKACECCQGPTRLRLQKAEE